MQIWTLSADGSLSRNFLTLSWQVTLGRLGRQDLLAHLQSFHAFPTSATHPMRPEEQPEAPSAPWRAASSFVMGAVGVLCSGFLKGLSQLEVHGMDEFLKLLDERENIENRERGLITGM